MTRQCILVGDVLEMLRTLPDNAVHCAVTSPPYWGLRDYGVSGQIGSEPTPGEYVQRLVEVFREMRRVLRDDGTLWLNLGDTYAGSGRGGNPPDSQYQKQKTNAGSLVSPMPVPTGLKPKDLCGIPWRVAFALQDDGWWLRQDIIWAKPNPMPSSVTDRCTTAHEYMFLLTKSPRYYFDAQAIAEPAVEPTRRRCDKIGGTSWEGRQQHSEGGTSLGHTTRNKRDVWWIGTQAYKGAHFATFPETLVEPCILAGTSQHGCCDQCGMPYARQVAKHRQATRPGRDTKIEGTTSDEHGNRDPARHVTAVSTVGWAAQCECGGGVVPCTVLDPFCGSGTTLAVARHYNRHAIGIELNSDYAALARERIRKGCTRVGRQKPRKRAPKGWELMEADDADAA